MELSAAMETLPEPALIEKIPDGRASDYVREIIQLEPSDLETLAACGPAHSTPLLKRVQAIHRTIALRIAAGDRPTEIAAKLAISPASISRLLNDPQFVELIEGYQGAILNETTDVTAMVGLVSVEAMSTLLERFEDEDQRKAFSPDELRKILIDTLDRTGHSPVRRSESNSKIVHSLSGDTIARIKEQHPEDNAYDVGSGRASSGLVASHEAASESAGVDRSVSDLFTVPQESEIDGCAVSRIAVSAPRDEEAEE